MRHDDQALTRHAARRCQQRGVRKGVLRTFLEHHDLDRDVGGGCRVLRMSRSCAQAKNQVLGVQMAARLSRLAVIVCDDTGQIVTAFHDTGKTRRYRAFAGGR